MPGGSSFIGGGGSLDPKTDRLGGGGGPVGADGLTDAQRKAQEADAVRRVQAGLPQTDTVEKINTSTGARTYIPPGTPGPGASPADQDLARARALAGHLSTLSNQSPRTAPQVAGAPLITSAQAGGTTYSPAATPTASLAGGPMMVSAPTMAAAQAAGPERVSAPAVGWADVGRAQTQQAIQVAPGNMAQANVGFAAPTALDNDEQRQLRAQQQDLFSGLTASAAGTGPSAALALHQKAVDQAIAVQRSLVAGAHGTGRVAAQLRAGQNIGQITGQAAADAAALKAKEQNDARALLTQGLSSARGQDIGVASTEAGLRQQSILQNAQNTTNVNVSNADREAARLMKDADLAQAAASGNMAAQNEMQLRQAEFQQTSGLKQADLSFGASTANQEANLRTALANAGFAQGANQTNATLGLSAAQGNQSAALGTALENARLGTQTSIAGAGFQNQTSLAQGSADLATALGNAGLQNTTNIQNANNVQDINKLNANLQAGQVTADDQKQANSVIAALQAQSQVLQTDDAKAKNALLQQQIQAAIKSGDRSFLSQLIGSGLGVLGTIGGALLAPVTGGASLAAGPILSGLAAAD